MPLRYVPFNMTAMEAQAQLCRMLVQTSTNRTTDIDRGQHRNSRYRNGCNSTASLSKRSDQCHLDLDLNLDLVSVRQAARGRVLLWETGKQNLSSSRSSSSSEWMMTRNCYPYSPLPESDMIPLHVQDVIAIAIVAATEAVEAAAGAARTAEAALLPGAVASASGAAVAFAYTARASMCARYAAAATTGAIYVSNVKGVMGTRT